ncbi:MAG: DNA mismatch repair protein MutS, partial [Candidatus Asgardarchaeia archaeon]
VTPLPDYYFDYDFAKETLLDHFKTATLEGFGVENYPLSVSSAGAIISYLIDTQRTNVENIKSLKTYHVTKFMLLDSTTIRNLELLQNFRDGSTHGTLIEVLDETKSAMGSRLLKKWLLYPLQDVNEIKNRLDAVEELVNKPINRRNIRSLIDEIYDLERIMSRLNLGRLNPKDLIALKDSLKIVPNISKELAEFKTPLISRIRTSLNGLPEIVKLIENAIVPDPPPTIQEGGVIKDGYNVELDSLRKLMRDAKKVIVEIEQKERNKTGIKSLKIGYNKVFGYYIEVPMTHIKRVPSDYIRKQTLTNAERFITPELKELEEKILTAEERTNQLEYELFLEVRDKVCRETDTIQKIANAISELDVLSTFAELAVNYNYTRPEIIDAEEGIIEIKNGRHPVVERLIEENFVPNDVYLDNTTSQIIIVTGPNMAGKSTYIRQVALITLLAHIGSFVPAEYARIGITDRIFTRVGAVDDISRRQSTFMVEMIETANILNNATDRSLIILDEIGRGTSTFDGMSIAWAVIEYIHNYIGAKTLFATHYHHITQIERILPRVKNYHIAVAEYENKMVFLRKVVEGPTDKSYGIHVARLAGLPEEVINRAEKVLHYIESTSNIEIPIEVIKKGAIKANNEKKMEEHPKIDELLPEIKIEKNEKLPSFKEKLKELEKEREEEDKTIKKGQATLEDFV